MSEKLLLKISDSIDFIGFDTFDDYYADPSEAQELCRKAFIKIFSAKFDPYSFKGLFYTTINRYFLADIKIFEHPLIAKNIVTACNQAGIKSVQFKIHNKNTELYNYYKNVLVKNGITASAEYHDASSYWQNSLTSEGALSALKTSAKSVVTILAQFVFLLVNYIFPKKYDFKKAVFWHSFANNREKIDYKFLDTLNEQPDVTVIHPNPYIFKSKDNWNKSIYFLGKYSINPFKYFFTAIKLSGFRSKFNTVLEDFDDLGLHYPEKWNTSTMNKTFLFMLFNLLENGLVEKIAKQREAKVCNVFRGGSAAGLIYSGMCKKKYVNDNVTGVLVPHGTEFNILDHFSYFYLDYNILPSEAIKNTWEEQLSARFSTLFEYNTCKLVAGGRIDYQLLNTNIIRRNPEPGKIVVGIVLTYNSETYQDTYIGDIKNAFEDTYGKGNCVFVIKPRPNRVFKPGNYMDSSVIVFDNDIYSFLNSIDVIAGTVSTYGILTMVVTDGIYCNIPGFYYIPNPKFNSNNLGYSYGAVMEDYTFNSNSGMRVFLNQYPDADALLNSLWDRNLQTKSYLTFNQDANVFLTDFLLKCLN